jgi:hypothetical protein
MLEREECPNNNKAVGCVRVRVRVRVRARVRVSTVPTTRQTLMCASYLDPTLQHRGSTR